jgi:hypothetical protein
MSGRNNASLLQMVGVALSFANFYRKQDPATFWAGVAGVMIGCRTFLAGLYPSYFPKVKTDLNQQAAQLDADYARVKGTPSESQLKPRVVKILVTSLAWKAGDHLAQKRKLEAERKASANTEKSCSFFSFFRHTTQPNDALTARS